MHFSVVWAFIKTIFFPGVQLTRAHAKRMHAKCPGSHFLKGGNPTWESQAPTATTQSPEVATAVSWFVSQCIKSIFRSQVGEDPLTAKIQNDCWGPRRADCVEPISSINGLAGVFCEIYWFGETLDCPPRIMRCSYSTV